MLIETIALGTITLTYKPPPVVHEASQVIPKISPVEPLPRPKIKKLYKIAVEPETPAQNQYGASEGNLYEPGQCVWFVKERRPELPNTWGDATNWLYAAQSQGWPTGSEPRVGAVGWVYGHVVLITAVHGDSVDYVDMNGNWVPFEIGYGTRPANYYTYIY